jgi:hypothetical protein
MKLYRVSFQYRPDSDPKLPPFIDTYAMNAYDASTGVLGAQDMEQARRSILAVSVAEAPEAE